MDMLAHPLDSAKIALEDLEKLEAHMRFAAMAPFRERASGRELATSILRDEKQKLSRLQAWALQWLSAMQRCINWAAAWKGLEGAPTLSYNQEVFEGLAGKPDFKLLLEMKALGVGLSDEFLISEAQRHGHASDHWEPEEVVEASEGEL